MQTKNFVLLAIGVASMLLLWFFAAYIFFDQIPTIIDVLKSIITDWKIHIQNSFASAYKSFFGLISSIILSTIIIVIVAIIPKFEYFITPYIVFVKSTPIIAFIPVIVILVGLNTFSVITSSVLISFFPIVIAGIDGLKRVPEKLLRFSKVYNANNWQIAINFSSGYIIESMLSSLKIAAPLSLIGAIVGEAVITSEGLGGYIMSNIPIGNASTNNPRIISILLSSAIGSLFYGFAYITHAFYKRNIFIDK